jgi:mannose-6-phosphate isomerase-like protein (cupin superfamily)
MEHQDVIAQIRFAAEKMRKVNLFETRNFFCDVYGLEPGQEQKDKVYFVLSGRGTFQVDEEFVELGEQQIVFAPAGSVHGVKNTSEARLTLLVFMTPNPNFK